MVQACDGAAEDLDARSVGDFEGDVTLVERCDLAANAAVRADDVERAVLLDERLAASEVEDVSSRILLISEDLEELMALADRIQVIYHGRLSDPIDARDVTAREIGLMMSGQARAA